MYNKKKTAAYVYCSATVKCIVNYIHTYIHFLFRFIVSLL